MGRENINDKYVCIINISKKIIKRVGSKITDTRANLPLTNVLDCSRKKRNRLFSST